MWEIVEISVTKHDWTAEIIRVTKQDWTAGIIQIKTVVISVVE